MDARLAKRLEAKCRQDESRDIGLRQYPAVTRTFAFRYINPDTGEWVMHRSVAVVYIDPTLEGRASIKSIRRRLFEPSFL